MDELHALALETIQLGKQALIFAPTRASAEKLAEEIARHSPAHLPELEQDILGSLPTPTSQCKRLARCVGKGIAFHHAGLLQKQRESIEDEFRRGSIKIICSTPTLAAGLSLPAFRVIIKSLKRYSGSWGMDWIPVLEYLQMAGRAGRPEYEKVGEAISLAKSEDEKQEIYRQYICGVPEEIFSKLNAEPVLRTYLLSLIASGVIRNEESLRNFFNGTFWAYRYGSAEELEDTMQRMLGLLQEWGFVRVEGVTTEGFVPASNLVWHSLAGKHQAGKHQKPGNYKATILGKVISDLYLDPLTARHLLDCLDSLGNLLKPAEAGESLKKTASQDVAKSRNLTGSSPTSFSLLQMISHTLELRPLLRVKQREIDFINQQLNQREEELLQPEPAVYAEEYGEFLCSVKTALFFNDWINEKDEEFLLEKYNIRPGEIRSKIEIAEWLLRSAAEIARVQAQREIAGELEKLRLRLQHGVREELLPLLRLRGVGRVRARRLYANGIRTLGDVKNCDAASLRQLVGAAIADSLKRQMGEEIREVPKGKRTGQVSIGHFGE